jgi:hypothetical protein
VVGETREALLVEVSPDLLSPVTDQVLGEIG